MTLSKWIEETKAQAAAKEISDKEAFMKKHHASTIVNKQRDDELVKLFHEAVDHTIIEIEKVIGKIGRSEGHLVNGAGSWMPSSQSYDNGQYESYKYYVIQWIIADGENKIYLQIGADYIEEKTIVVPVIRATYNNPYNYSSGERGLFIKTNSLVITAEEIEPQIKTWLKEMWRVNELSGKK